MTYNAPVTAIGLDVITVPIAVTGALTVIGATGSVRRHSLWRGCFIWGYLYKHIISF